jgi:molybdenum cofactor guanylyltransferase
MRPSGNQNLNNLLGVVMCGGLSTRMGRDKGLIMKKGKTWSEIAYKNLASLQIPVYVSVNEFQLSSYNKIFGLNNLVVDDNELNGPLKGLMAVHRKFPEKDLFILASDMTDMNTSLLQELSLSYLINVNFDFHVFKNDTELEPLCAIYKAEALDRIRKTYLANQLHKHSMKYILSLGTICTIPLTIDKKACFANYNESF